MKFVWQISYPLWKVQSRVGIWKQTWVSKTLCLIANSYLALGPGLTCSFLPMAPCQEIFLEVSVAQSTGGCFFLSVNFATSLLPLLAWGKSSFTTSFSMSLFWFCFSTLRLPASTWCPTVSTMARPESRSFWSTSRNEKWTWKTLDQSVGSSLNNASSFASLKQMPTR